MARANQSMSMLVDSAADAHYEGVQGQMPGGPTFFAAALFFVSGAGVADQVVVGNTPPGPTATGWAIGVRGVGGVPVLIVTIATNAGVHERQIPMPQSLGKIVLVHVSVLGGLLDVVVNGNAAVVSDPLPGAALPAAGGSPTVGALSGGAAPANLLGIVGVGYSTLPGNAVVAIANMTQSRGIYDLADEFEQSNGVSWTHWYTVRRGLVAPGDQAQFTGPDLTGLPTGAAQWQPAPGNGSAPDLEPRVPLTRIGASTTAGTVLVLDNPLWAPIANAPPLPPAEAAAVVAAGFSNNDLVAGVYTFNHNLNTFQPTAVTIRDNNGVVVAPDSDTVIDPNNIAVDLTSQGAIAGLWTATVVG